MLIHIDEPYLWLPVDKKNPEVKLHFYCNDTKFQEIDIQLGNADGDFYTSMDVSRFLGQDVVIKGALEEDRLYHIFCHKEKVQNVYPFRPQMHFTPEIGWMNDPNGLVYADGVYHLYYQWNPYGVIWGNMHWGHAVSKDMITWEHRPMVMEPDKYGPIFSGCGWQDKDNTAGFGENALLFFYTASGGTNQWSIDEGNQHTQRLAVSLDGGETLKKIEGTVLDHIVAGNRDPKVFYHANSSAYIMVLYLDEYEFAIFRSTDLLHWSETQRFSAEGMWECPDLFELPVMNAPNEKKWVFWSADGFYLIGDFDGYRFEPESEVQSAYSITLPYAAQTYAGIEDRIISIAWLRTESNRGNCRGAMSLPSELSLKKTETGYKIRFQKVKEFLEYRVPLEDVQYNVKAWNMQLSGRPVELILRWKEQASGHTKLLIGDTSIEVRFDEEKLEVKKANQSVDTISIPLEKKEAFDLDVVIDQDILEFYGNDGMIYGVVEIEENVLRKTIILENEAEIETMELYSLSKEVRG